MANIFGHLRREVNLFTQPPDPNTRCGLTMLSWNRLRVARREVVVLVIIYELE